MFVFVCKTEQVGGDAGGEEVEGSDRDAVLECVCVFVCFYTSSTPSYIKSLSIHLMKAVIAFRHFGFCPGLLTGRFIPHLIPGENFQSRLSLKIFNTCCGVCSHLTNLPRSFLSCTKNSPACNCIGGILPFRVLFSRMRCFFMAKCTN